ncbi:MAG: galactose-1-phosphate uridylyltransferase [Candidatus Abyssobacteria bacterium SURF_17]|uniref:Galactose-1-phosphate uridylyltransferase n=1 Tax=Candidatus Abyssobacteria bacterium SURF_17 TaxID=2093361 RepID=A0A419ERT3_9BACT|nr:MAG: galactose-1-phosphate uridylyltransferase [Candidatus Abyssubacteria bacterium SURF_17]
MPEFRQNIVTKEWVIISTERAKRPDQFAEHRLPRKATPEFSQDCPFCPGNEHQTPPPSLQLGDGEGWSVRVVPNKYAALRPDHSTKRERAGRFLKADGYGIAEVIIETPLHNLSIATMSEPQVRLVLEAYRHRKNEVAKMRDINFITLFRNHGERAGTSLEHPHSQLIATPIIPPHVRDQIHQAMSSYDSYGTCVFCEMIEEELSQNVRIVMDSRYFVAFAPFASRSPFELRIYPKTHRSFFGNATDDELDDLAHILKTLLLKIHTGLDNPDYNYLIRSAPVGDYAAKYYHWYMVIVPRLTTPAGFEMGSGIYINVSTPEQCAEFLRSVNVA